MINKRLVQFKSGSFYLTGQWDEPADVPAYAELPAVLFGHGFTGNRFESRRMYTMLSARLVAKGIRTFRFDHRGCGDSEGEFREFTSAGYMEDIEAGLAEFLAGPGIDMDRTAVVGYSLGGMTASYWLNGLDAWRTAVMWAPVARPDIIRDRLATYPDFKNYRAKGFFDYMGFRVCADYIDNIGGYNPIQWVRAFEKPILFIQGDADPIVKPEQVKIYLEARNNSRDKLLLVSGGDHAFTTAENIDRVIDASVEWLDSFLME